MSLRRILGIDPGLQRTGFGVIEVRGNGISWIESGVLRIGKGDLASRLAEIHSGLREVIARTAPTEASVEKVFVNVNPQSTLLLGQARGAALCAASLAGLAVHEYTALQVKQAITGYGHADKAQMQKMVRMLLGLEVAPPADAADALACAICQAHAGKRTGTAIPAGASRRKGSTRSAWNALAQARGVLPSTSGRGAGVRAPAK